MANRLFFILMALSAALGFGKALGIAALLTADDFGRYSVLIAIALFLSPLPGLGLIEETRKLFPRMFVDGKIAEMAYRADRIAGVVGLRTAALGLLGAAIFLLAGYELAAVIAASLTLVAFGASWCSIMASALRAGTSPILLGAASFARAALTIPITLLAAHEYGLLGVLAGEALAAVAGGAIMRFAFRWRPQSEPIEQLPVVEAKASRDGMLVFYGTALVSAPIYLSRSVAALSLTAAQVGTLNFLLVFVAIFQTAIAIADQVVGPRFVHWQHSGQPMRFQERRFLLTVSALAAATILAFLLLWLAMQLPPLAPLVNKYEVTATLVIPAAILAALSITSTADWMLQAHDKERWLTISGVVNLASFAVLSALVLAHAIDMGGYLWGLAAGKLLQLTVQLWVILHIRDSEPDVEGRTDLPARMPAVDRFEP